MEKEMQPLQRTEAGF